MNRRQFLGAGTLAAAAAAGAGATLAPRRAAAQPFGEPLVPEHAKALLPPEKRAQSVLECFLYGGLTLWESFYCVKEYGRPDDPDPALRNTHLYTFHNPESALLEQALKKCGMLAEGGDVMSLLQPFATDALGAQVQLGPLCAPLAARPDVTARMRVVVNRHTLEPHEAAIPLAMCGRPLGSPTLASLGAHVQRWALERDTTGRRSPFCYAFASNYFPTDNVRATIATGAHPGSSRPLFIKVDDAARLSQLLARKTVGEHRKQHDRLVDAYLAQYQRRLRHGGQGDPVRSPRLADLAQSARAVSDAESVEGVFDAKLFTPIDGAMCGATAVSVPAMSLRLATHLLTHPVEPARWCCFVDPGLVPADGGGGYDTHFECVETQSRNSRVFFEELLARVNAPGEGDPTKLDLDRTMIVLNMEFGRTPYLQPGGQGRNHWPFGYAQIYIGGPIGPEQRGVHGAIGPDGFAPEGMYTTPAENRIAALLAMGIWPFSPDTFGVSDVQGAGGEFDAAVSVTQRVLGHQVGGA